MKGEQNATCALLFRTIIDLQSKESQNIRHKQVYIILDGPPHLETHLKTGDSDDLRIRPEIACNSQTTEDFIHYESIHRAVTGLCSPSARILCA